MPMEPPVGERVAVGSLDQSPDQPLDQSLDQGSAAHVGTYFGALEDGRAGGPGGGRSSSTARVSACGEAEESVDVRRTPVEQSVGPEECRSFFGEPLAHVFRQGIELSHRSTGRPGRKAGRDGDRGSGRSEDPHHEATRGVGPVTGPAGSESLQGRGGRHPASSLEGLLVLIPSRGPHPYFRSGTGPADPRAGPGRSRFAGRDLGPGQRRRIHTAGQLAAPAR